MSSVLVVRGKVRRPWRTRHIPAEVIVTRPNGEVIVIPAGADKVRRKASSTRKVQPVAVSPQDTVAIDLAERKARVLQTIGSIHKE